MAQSEDERWWEKFEDLMIEEWKMLHISFFQLNLLLILTLTSVSWVTALFLSFLISVSRGSGGDESETGL